MKKLNIALKYMYILIYYSICVGCVLTKRFMTHALSTNLTNILCDFLNICSILYCVMYFKIKKIRNIRWCQFTHNFFVIPARCFSRKRILNGQESCSLSLAAGYIGIQTHLPRACTLLRVKYARLIVAVLIIIITQTINTNIFSYI